MRRYRIMKPDGTAPSQPLSLQRLLTESDYADTEIEQILALNPGEEALLKDLSADGYPDIKVARIE